MTSKVSLPVIRRLPRYFRYVLRMKRNGVKTVSSSMLASMMGTTASQVRQDFNCFGGFGQQGIGYNVEILYDELAKLLFTGRELTAVLIGSGKLGRAVASFLAGEATGFTLGAIFDRAPEEIGQELAGLKVRDVKKLKEYCKKHKPQVAVLCIPEESAAELAPTLAELGIEGFWNFSHYDLPLGEIHAVVENVHLGDSLMSLGFQVRHPAEAK